ncbi:MAG: hypothetical protein F2667_09340 [Actinobacteria bacterium]|uniref:Unannotated protein n=1 Tax=freshwater metagenome TaxID=449393 RepID=A0A6J6R3P6_9ZZZZ|nr:hypothetical protein [Actinomycetota bacterium]
MDVSAILWALIGGTVIGLLGKWVAPGERDEVPLWLTILCGVGGILVGNFAYQQFFDATTRGVDWWRHAWQVAAAALIVSIAARATGRTR